MGKPHVGNLQRHEGFFPRVRTGKYVLSMQGSENHYCVPQVDCNRLGEYAAVEVVIFLDDNPVQCPIEKFSERFNTCSGTMAPYMPLNEVQELFEELLNS